MRSIGTRLAVWYALASMVTLSVIVIAGYYLLATHLVASLDNVNRHEFQQLRARLKSDFAVIEPEAMAERLRDATEAASIPIYVDARLSGLGTVFASENLEGNAIPDGPPVPEFNTKIEGVGRLRVGRFNVGRMNVLMASSLEDTRRVLTGYLQVALPLVLVTAAVSCLVGLGLSRAALRPVRAIQRTAEHITSDNLSERIPVDDVADEISNLARLLNRTFERLENAFNQVRRFTAEASHELKTPLALARAHAEHLLQGGAAPHQTDELQNLLEELTQLEKIVEALLLLSRADAHAVPLELRRMDPHAFVRHFAEDARVLGEYSRVRIEQTCHGSGSAEFDPKWIRQVLLNLLSNALRVSPRGSLIKIESTIIDRTWRVSIEDEGPGVPAALLERIFERFFRLPAANDDDKGAGLGLAISRSIIALHRGTIRAELPNNGRGLRVIVELPAEDVGPTRVIVDGNSLARASEIAS
jgi:signal transduction histidine kinase